jgi:hypothetical protein
VFWVISVYFNRRNTLPKFGIFLLGHPVYSEEEVEEEDSIDTQEEENVDIKEEVRCENTV